MQVEVKQPSPEVPPEITRRELKPCLTVDTVRSDSFGSHDSKNASLQRNDLAVIGEMGTPASRQETPRRTGNTAKREDVPDGNPPIDVGEDMKRIQVLMKDEEHLTAFSLYQEIVEYVEGLEQGVEKESCLRTLEAHQEDITTLKVHNVDTKLVFGEVLYFLTLIFTRCNRHLQVSLKKQSRDYL